MTRKHFEAAAKSINTLLNCGLPDAKARAEGAAAVFITVASEANPRFDSIRFLTACGLR